MSKTEKNQYFGVYVDGRGAVKVGDGRATEEGAIKVVHAAALACKAEVKTVEAANKADAREKAMASGLVEPTQEEIDAARAGESGAWFVVGLGATGAVVASAESYPDEIEAALHGSLNEGGVWVEGTSAVIEADDQVAAVEAYTALGGVIPSEPVRKGGTKRRSRGPAVPPAEPLTIDEIAAFRDQLEEGKFAFPMSQSGMAYRDRYTPRGGVFDFLVLDVDDLATIGGDAWTGEHKGALRGRPVKDLHGASCKPVVVAPVVEPAES